MAAAFDRLDKISNELATMGLHKKTNPKKTELPGYYWDRLIRNLVLAGYGDYEAAANADLIDAAVFLLLGNDKHERARRWLDSESVKRIK